MSRAREIAELGAVYDSGALSNRNLIINGAMQVAQRGTSVTVGSTGSSGFRSVDRFNFFNPIAVIAEQSSDAPDDFTYSCKMTKDTTSSTNLTSIGCFRYGVELQDIYQLAYGTSLAKTITLSFYVKSSHAGTYNVLLLNHGGNTQRQVTKLYTVNSANTWEYKTLTISGDTDFAGHTDDPNSMGLSLDFICTPSGAWSGGTVNTSDWADNVSANRISTSQANALQSDGDSFAITGVQLEVGPEATPFEHRSYGDELARCQRYYQRYNYSSDTASATTANTLPVNCCYTTTVAYGGSPLQQEMRTSPTFSASGSWVFYSANNSYTVADLTAYETGPFIWGMKYETSGTWTAGNAVYGRPTTTSSYVSFDAEL